MNCLQTFSISIYLTVFMYADGIVIVPSSDRGLQKGIDVLCEDSIKWKP